jgi:hypothetical protein
MILGGSEEDCVLLAGQMVNSTGHFDWIEFGRIGQQEMQRCDRAPLL